MEDMSNVTDYISLPILVKINDTWQINNKARLPVVEHGDTDNSIKLTGDLEVDNVTVTDSVNAKNVTAVNVDAEQLTQNSHIVTLLDIEELQTADGADKYYRLHFTGAATKNSGE
jgi:hypothetical protein